jgi:hypothetical protein
MEVKAKPPEPEVVAPPESEELEMLVVPEEEEKKSDVKTIQVDTNLLAPKL